MPSKRRPSSQPMTSRPYVPDSIKAPSTNQHPVVRALGPNALNAAVLHVMRAAEELAAELGKRSEELTDEEAAQAIKVGKQRHAEQAK